MWESLLSAANLNEAQSLTIGLPEHYTLDDLSSRIRGSQGETGIRDALLTTVVYLSRSEFTAWDDDRVSSNLIKAVSESLPSPDTNPEDETAALVAEAGIACLHLLSLARPCNIDDTTLLKVVAFTNFRDSWTTGKAASLASGLLRAQLSGEKLTGFVIGPTLQTFLKPLFAKSSSRITASGRPAHYQTATDVSSQPPKTSSWKDHAPWAMSTLRWAVDASESSLIRDNWPLFTPALLALAEDESIEIKSSGLEILALFVGKCPAQVLHTTGIGLIFEDVTFPALLYLPSLTPEDESVKLLAPAYSVLLALAETHQPPQSPHRRRLLDKTLREGVFSAYAHASEYARLVQLLMESTASIVKCMGIYSIKHLKSLLSVISSVMEDPFVAGHGHPPAILAASKALCSTITNCWPRLQGGEHSEQIIRMLSLCWLNLCEDGTAPRLGPDDFDALSRELLQTSSMLQLVWAQNNTNPPAGLGEVLEEEPRLAQLFPTLSSRVQTSPS